MLDKLPCGYLEFDDDGLLRQVNNKFCEILGYRSEELIDNHVKTILTPGATVFYETHLFPMIKMENHVDEIYLTLLSKKDEKVPVLINAERSMEGESGLNRCIVVKMQRRSEYEDQILYAKEKAEETSEDKKKLISMMSHELRAPLTVILGTVNLLSSELESDADDDIADYLQLIESSSKNMARLAEDILNFAKLETGNFSIHPEELLLEEILDETFLMAKQKAINKDIRCIRSQKTNTKIYADRDRLQQVLMNLLTNAIKFTESGGSIELETEKDDQIVKIHVRDTGPGIPADKIEQIFQPFIQIKSQNSDSHKDGFGLGLSISRNLSREMGGDLIVNSTLGEGTVFTVHVLLKDEEIPEI